MDPDLTIVLLGNSGVGKSASGNTILGRPAFESKESAAPVTTEISAQTETLFGKQVSVVDTPRIFGSESKIQTFCQELLQSNRPCLFLVVVKMDRFTIEQKNAVEASIRVTGDQFNSCYLLFTRGNNNMTLDEFISTGSKELRSVVGRFKGRHHVFNINDGGQEQVRELLEKSGHPINVAQPKTVRRIVLLGLPGAGKSETGNTILGSDQFDSGCDFDPVTAEAVSESAIVEGRQVTVVDTPGFSVENLTCVQLFKGIMKVLVKASPGPHAFVFVVRLGRITEADVKMFEHLPKLFNSDVCSAHQYSMVLFTHGNELKGRSIDDLIHSQSKNAQHVSKLVSMCGGRYCVLDNGDKKSREQVRNLLKKIDEMVTVNGGQHFTNDEFKMADGLKSETVPSGKKVPPGEKVPPGATAGNTGGPAGGPDDIAWEKMYNFVYDHRFEIFCGIVGLILGGAVGAKVGLKLYSGSKVAVVIGGAVGAAVGTTAGIVTPSILARVKAIVLGFFGGTGGGTGGGQQDQEDSEEPKKKK